MMPRMRNILGKKNLITTEPYVIYSGFNLGSYPDEFALSELNLALKSHYKVVILIDDTKFSADLLEFIQVGSLCDKKDMEIFLKAQMFIKTGLVSSLPKNAKHPALIYLKNTFEKDINARVAPTLVHAQLESWGLKHQRIIAFSKSKLEQQVQ